MSQRQKSLDMRNLTNQLIEVVKWYPLGVALGIPAYKLDAIEQNQRGDVGRCKMGMLDVWLRSDLEASWEKLARALEDDYVAVAARIRKKYLGSSQVGSRVVPDFSSPLPQPPTPMEVDTLDQQMAFALQLIRSQQVDKSEQLVSSLAHWDFDIDYASPEQTNQTLLHFAAQNGDADTVQMLIVFGANVNCKNSFGQTPMDIAMMQGHKNIMGLLGSVGGKSSLKPQEETWSSLAEGASLIKKINGYRVLSLDNSGTTAIIQLEILSRFEQQTGRRIVELFDWIVASGIGALLIIGMIYANKTVAELRKMYFRLREKVFAEKRSGFRSNNMEVFLKELLGTEMRMCDKTYPRLLIGALNKKTTRLELHLFNNCLHDQFSQTPVWKVGRYTSASPISIAEFEGYVDGGTLCSNLCDHALTRIREFCKRGEEGRIGCVVSIGSGIYAPEELGCVDAHQYLSCDTPWDNPMDGQKRVMNIIVLQLSANAVLSEEMAKNCASQCESVDIPFYRFNPTIEETFPLLGELDLNKTTSIIIQTIVQILGKKLEELGQCLQDSIGFPPGAGTGSGESLGDSSSSSFRRESVRRDLGRADCGDLTAGAAAALTFRM